MLVLLLGLAFQVAAFSHMTSSPTPGCKNGTKPCVYAPGKQACCTPGEACVPKVGCRCEGGADCLLEDDEFRPTPSPTSVPSSCPSGTKVCDFAPGKSQCCTPGEACVPNVGCRCDDEKGCQFRPTPSPTTCPSGEKVCEYAPGKSQCCTPGEACVQGVGCRCDGDDCFQANADLGIFGNPRDICKRGTRIAGPPLNATLKFTAVTWNLEGWARQPQLVSRQAAVLLSYAPDFIATQEDRFGWDMQHHLGEGKYCFMGETREGRVCSPTCPTKVPLSSNGGDGEHTFIYYNCKKWQVLETNTYFLGLFSDGYPRVYTNGFFQNLQTKHTIWITSTHFPKKTAQSGQEKCVQDLAYMGDSSKGDSLLMGDFNIVEETAPSPLYKPWKTSGFIFDSYNVCERCHEVHHGYDKHFATFTDGQVWVDDAHDDLSDHSPVIAYYEI